MFTKEGVKGGKVVLPGYPTDSIAMCSSVPRRTEEAVHAVQEMKVGPSGSTWE